MAVPPPTVTDFRLAKAMLDEVESFFETGIGAAIARRLADDCGFDLKAELEAAREELATDD